MSVPYKGRSEFIAFYKWIVENTPRTVHIDVDLSKRSIELIVDNTEDAMTILMNWY